MGLSIEKKEEILNSLQKVQESQGEELVEQEKKKLDKESFLIINIF